MPEEHWVGDDGKLHPLIDLTDIEIKAIVDQLDDIDKHPRFKLEVTRRAIPAKSQ